SVTAGSGTSFQTGTVATALPLALQVVVTDARGNPVPDGRVATFVVTSGGGTLTQATATTVNGVATTSLTLGATVGTNTVVASVAGFSTQVTFFATGNPGAPAQLVFTRQPANGHAGPVGEVDVTIEDAFGNVVTNPDFTINMSLGTHYNASFLQGDAH